MKQERYYGIDLLKIFSMFMVSLMHVLGQGGLFSQYERGTGNFLVGQVLLGLAFCAVDCFAMATGFVMTENRFRYSRILPLWLTVLFYGCIISGLFSIIDPTMVDGRIWLHSLLPVLSRTYWYFTSYFLLFFLMPLLNRACDQMTRRESMRLLIILFLLLSIATTFLRFSETMPDPFVMMDGAHPMWLIYMYLIGAHFKRHVPPFPFSRLIALLVFLLCTTALVLSGWFMERSPFYVYTSPLVVIQSVCLLLIFTHTDFMPGHTAGSLLRLISSLSFSAYLFQLHPIVWNNLLKDRFAPYANLSPARTTFFCLGIALLLYLGSLTFDLVRFAVFRLLRVHELSAVLFAPLDRSRARDR